MLRSRITLLVAATASAVVLTFVIPLALLVQAQAEDRLLAAARQRAQSVAMMVAGGAGAAAIDAAVTDIPDDSGAQTSVVLATDSSSAAARDPAVMRARQTRSALTQQRAQEIEALVPVALPSGIAVVRTSVPTEPTTRRVWTAWAIIAALAAALLGFGLLVARSAARRIATPLAELASTAERLRHGDVAARAAPRGPAEIVQLGAALNLLADRIDELVRAEREAVADLSHRLRTPMTALAVDTESIPQEALRERIQQHVSHLSRTIDSIIADARRPLASALPDPSRRVDLVAVVQERARFWTPLAQDQGRALNAVLPAGPTPVRLTVDDARDLVDNLIDNVFAHTPEGSPLRLEVRVAIRVESGDIDGPGGVQLVVDDGGDGAPDPRSDALERGVSGGDSTGLGLDIVRRLARDAGGRVELDRSPLGGWRVVVHL